MTVEAIVRLALLNLFFLLVGSGVLWGLRGWASWRELLRLGGVAYLLGIAAMIALLSLQLVLGVPFGAVSLALSGSGVLVTGALLGKRYGRRLPRLRWNDLTLSRISLLTAFVIASMLLYFQAFFRSGRLQGIGPDWDAWRAWTLRAKQIYFDGHLDASIPSLGQYPSYPPGISVVQASAFHAMGTVDDVTLHLVGWFFAIGFVWAVAGLLIPHVRSVILAPILLVLLLMPKGILEWGTFLMADLPMAYLLVAAALLLVLWVHDHAMWRVSAAALLLGAAMLTKREGLLFALVLILAGAIASVREWRRFWLPLAGCALAALALAVPWRSWIVLQDLPSDGPTAGYFGFIEHLGRGWPSLRLIVSTIFSSDHWLFVPVLAIVATFIALVAREARLAGYALAVFTLSVLGATWIIWSNPHFPITQDYALNPVGRLTITPVLILGALTPLMLERSWHAVAHRECGRLRPADRVRTRKTTLALMAIVLVALFYPGSMLFGISALRLPGGIPSFPSADDCSLPAAGDVVRIVFGYASSYEEVTAVRTRARASGASPSVTLDSCGRLRVSVDGVRIDEAREIIERARAASLGAVLEGQPRFFARKRAVAQRFQEERTLIRARQVPRRSCRDEDGRRLLPDGTAAYHLRRIGNRVADGWAIEGVGLVTEAEFAEILGGAGVISAGSAAPHRIPVCS